MKVPLVSLLVAVAVSAAGALPTPDQVEFFETHIRPVLAEQCYGCHSEKAEKVKGSLKLDTPAAIMRGGSSGPIFVPGNPDHSLLIKAVRYSDPDLQMPPKDKKLPSEIIADFESWVRMGAPMPESVSGLAARTPVEEARSRHWAFQAVNKPSPPEVKDTRWVRTPVDQFILATLEKKRLKPAAPVDLRTLIRRVSYDLIGLPPTPEEVEAFVKDCRRDAYERVVERLLASPHYGERWGRYWLDIARYADTKGYLAGGEERRYAFSYTYRDYVVRSFNEDKPYDQFILEQLAADCLPHGEDRSALAALGFLTLGRRFLNNQNDIIDDRIDVVTRGTLGLTVGCARCHDHKFDPISAKDYYALHGVFASSEEPAELPLLGPLGESEQYQDFLKKKAGFLAEIEQFKEKETGEFLAGLRQHVGDYLLGARDATRSEDQSKFETFAGERKLNPDVLRRWIKDLESRENDPVLGPWIKLSKLSEQNFLEQANGVLESFATNPPSVNPKVLSAIQKSKAKSLGEVAGAYAGLFKETETEWQHALSSAKSENRPAPTVLADAESEQLRRFLYSEGALNLPRSETDRILARRLGEGAAPIRNKIEALNWTHPGAPPRAMALLESAQPHNSRVLLRGNPGNPGPEVPRRFLEVLTPSAPVLFTNGSGRLDLARAITSPDNPLTARVYVNRVWLHHFGEGLVPTPGDFGVRTEAPVHRALLDYLAAAFIENGWSTKYLHRVIVLSATYQQSCDASPASLQADPENHYLSRMNRQRLDFEAMRDSLLAFSGKLDSQLAGLPVDIENEPFSSRRTIYGLIERQNLPAVFRTFDFANPDTSSQRRFHTTVPQQALFLLNSPFVIAQARSLAARKEVRDAVTPSGQVQALYHLVFQRSASSAEVKAGKKFLSASSPSAGLSGLEKYAQVLLLSNETMFLD
jgi:hypothetical protein